MKRLLVIFFMVMLVAALVVPVTQASKPVSMLTCEPNPNTASSNNCAPCDPTDPMGGCYEPPTCDPTDPMGGCYNPPPCDPTDPMGGCYNPPCDSTDPMSYCYIPPCGVTGNNASANNNCNNDPCGPNSLSSAADNCDNDPCGPNSLRTGHTTGDPMNCDEPVVNNPVVNPPVVNGRDDNGISFNDSDLGVVLYQSQDANGNASLDIYDMKNAGTEGAYMFSVTQEDLAAYVGNAPAENTLLKAGGHVSVYILTTGEIQMNVGPDSEGKIHVKIFDGIPWTHVYSFTIDPE